MSWWIKWIGGQVALIAVVGAMPSEAGIRATYVGSTVKNGQSVPIAMTFTVDDAGNDRIDTVYNGSLIGWLVHRDGDAWIIQKEKTGWVVMRQADFAAVSNERDMAMAGKSSDDGPYDIVDLGPATVAARAGETYGLRKRGDTSPVERAHQFVISTDPALAPLARALAREAAEMPRRRTSAGDNNIGLVPRTVEILSRGGLLSRGDASKLDSVETVDVPATTFDLPGPVLSLDQVRARMAPPAPPAFVVPGLPQKVRP